MISIDLGSNTFRCIAYDCVDHTFGDDFEQIVKTADRMHESGCISDEAIERVLNAIKDADKQFDFKAHDVRAVTTAAMRMAENAQEVLQRLKVEGGVDFEIIDADREANFSVMAVKHRLDQLNIASNSFVLIDIGGGSTEVIFIAKDTMQSQSFPIGIVTVAQQCATPHDVKKLLSELLVPVKKYVDEYHIRNEKPQMFVNTAGTPTTIAAFLQGMTYRTYNVSKINGFVLTQAACQKALDGLIALDEERRATYVGVGRETLIVAGVVIVQMFYELLGFDESIVIDDGVREGVAIDYCR
ncbi:MAG: phosphatase [Epsilonproteobacteria bacterium]|nr:MAG: phosphatase [Campylobacterota bacterium]